MSYLNKTLLIGNVGQEPEIRTFDNGDKIAMFSLATSKSYKQDSGEYKTITQWHRIIVKNKGLIDNIIAKGYIVKGTKLYLEGELMTREFVDKDTKLKNKITEIIVNINHTIQMLSSRDKNVSSQNDISETDDEIPF